MISSPVLVSIAQKTLFTAAQRIPSLLMAMALSLGMPPVKSKGLP